MKTIFSYLNQISYWKNLSLLGLMLICFCLNCSSFGYTQSKKEKIQGYLERGDIYFRAENYPSYVRAEKQYRNVIHLDPTNYEAYSRLGYIYYIFYENHLWRNRIEDAAQAWNEAYHCFNAALKYKPSYDEACIGLAMIYHCVQRYDKAIELLEQVLSLPKADDLLKGKAYFWLGRCYIGQNKFSEMVRVFKEYLKILPKGSEADELRRAIREVGRNRNPDKPKTAQPSVLEQE